MDFYYQPDINSKSNIFFSVLPPFGISPCVRTVLAVMPPPLGAALLYSSRACSNMLLLSSNSIVHRDWGRTIGVCSFIIVVGFVELSLLCQICGFLCNCINDHRSKTILNVCAIIIKIATASITQSKNLLKYFVEAKLCLLLCICTYPVAKYALV